ncbi:YceI family protein [Marinobacter sp. M216]|uniref:YceI family protein n=1 Tax=Marinobacter albus TaxID=3030833 RepID=A0ABT7HB90_9GAMM|nr:MULTISPECIES: YceI family protein [unclassified Marinobacter]MBW7470097.1 YceI family protein [Marinobacter sp. F4218]MDK9557639.1 YceI family protein [Marinobacter sp. M216]
MQLPDTISRISRFAFLPALMAVAPVVSAEPAKFTVDSEHFSMAFEIMHIGYAPVIGMFREVDGEFVYDEATGDLNSGTLVFQSDSVFTNHKKRDDHLRGEDFLNSAKYPEIVFTLTEFESTGENAGKVTGDLTMLGQTNPVVLDVTLNKSAVYPIGHEDFTLGISAETILKRSDWGMTYGLDSALVGDEVRMRFGFEANRDSGWF